MPFEVERVVEKIVEKEVPVYVEQIVMKEVRNSQPQKIGGMPVKDLKSAKKRDS